VNLEELRAQLLALQPGQMAGINYDVYNDLFPPGEPDENARAACFEFARAVGCRIENRPADRTVWFIRDA
jgi:hypothetical protein